MITKGAHGAVLHQSGMARSSPARDVQVVDTTGAGDAFAAGFLYRIADGRTPADAVTAGIDWAAAAVPVSDSIPPRWSAVPGWLSGR